MQYIGQHIDMIFHGDAVSKQFGYPPDLSKQQFINVNFIDADFSNAKVEEAHFHNVQFIRCNLTSVNFTEAKFTGNDKPH